ncbi:MAG: ATP-dependent DNA ligase [Actinobacteria bacterium]|nr:ATP-dependent DNA ligase [Actinomycetota bacterium]
MDLPVEGPISPMLAKLQTEIPAGEGWLYEPKWDGFRSIVFRDGDEVQIWSRQEKPLNRYFPELPAILRASLPERSVVDGEIIVSVDGKLDFDALQLRIHPAASRAEKLSQEIPAGFVAFDLLAIDDRDLMATPFAERRELLEKHLTTTAEVSVTPQTSDLAAARAWLQSDGGIGLEAGLIAKQTDLLYKPKSRAMVKVKKLRTADTVVGGYRLNKAGDGVGALLLGVYDGDVLQYVGHTSSFKAAERRDLLELMRSIEGGESFGKGRSPGGQSRWASAKEDPWIAVEPKLVCEVSFDKMQQERFRHAATFLHWRTDKAPEECTWDQLTA